MNTQIFNFIKYDLNGHLRSQKVTFMFIITLTYVLMDNCLSLFLLTDLFSTCFVRVVFLDKETLTIIYTNLFKNSL